MYHKEMDAPNISAIVLHSAQRQMLAFMHDVETKGVDVGSIFSDIHESALYDIDSKRVGRIHSGLLAADMGYGKTAAVIGLCTLRRMKTLVVAPQMGIEQWVEQFRRCAPHLKVRSLYCVDQARGLEDILTHDILVIAPTSRLIQGIQNWTRRIVVDEAHDVVCKLAGRSDVVKFLYSKCHRHVWAVSGTPFLQVGDKGYHALMRFLLQTPLRARMRHRNSVGVNHLRQFILRMTKNLCDANGVRFLRVPEVTYKTMPIDLDNDARTLYNIACCIDSWSTASLRDASSYSTDATLLSEVHARMEARVLSLGHQRTNLHAFLKTAMARVHASDMYPRDMLCAKLERLEWLTAHYCSRVATKHVCADAVMLEMTRLKREDPRYKAILVTDSSSCGQYVSRKWEGSVGIMQRPFGSNARLCHAALRSFQNGEFDLLVCSNEAMQTGINLQEARHIFFVEQRISDPIFHQACTRIARYGTQHAELSATFVYARNTVEEDIAQYHMRRKEASIRQAMVPILDAMHKLVHHDEAVFEHPVMFHNEAFIDCSREEKGDGAFNATLTIPHVPFHWLETPPTYCTLEHATEGDGARFPILKFQASDMIPFNVGGKRLTTRVDRPSPEMAETFLKGSPRKTAEHLGMRLYAHTHTGNGTIIKQTLQDYKLVAVAKYKVCELSGDPTLDGCDAAFVGSIKEHTCDAHDNATHLEKELIQKMQPLLKTGHYLHNNSRITCLRRIATNSNESTQQSNLYLHGMSAKLCSKKRVDALPENPLRLAVFNKLLARSRDRYRFDTQAATLAHVLSKQHFSTANKEVDLLGIQTSYRSILVRLVDGKVGDIISFTHQHKRHEVFVRKIVPWHSTEINNIAPHVFAIVSHTKKATNLDRALTEEENLLTPPHGLPFLGLDEIPKEESVTTPPFSV